MNSITHKQAIKLIHLRLDGMLKRDQALLMEEHLKLCDSCRSYAREIGSLPAQLNTQFKERWDARQEPSPRVAQQVSARARRIPMQQHFSSGVKLVTGVAVLAVLAFAMNFVVSRLQDTSLTTTQTTNGTPFIFQGEAAAGLLAFTAEKDSNADIYTMYADGTGMTNLTNNPAQDVNPFWSPDGKRIAFESDRDGFKQIFIMDADGSNVVQITSDTSDHQFANSDPWSPDGTRLLLTEKAPGNEKWILYITGVDGKSKTHLAEVPGIYNAQSWSPDGQHVAFLVQKLPEGSHEREVTRIHIIDPNGENLTDATKLVPSDEDLSTFSYSWSHDGQSISFIANRYYYENGNGRSALYEADLDGDPLTEIDHVSTDMADYWEGTALIRGTGNPPLMWLRPDGTHSTLNAYKNCEVSTIQRGLYLKRSSRGDLLIGAGCANDDWWFHWVNPDGTIIQQFLDHPIAARDGFIFFDWSPDGRYIALNVTSSDKTSLYVLNVADTLKDPSTAYVQIDMAAGAQEYSISWQPTP